MIWLASRGVRDGRSQAMPLSQNGWNTDKKADRHRPHFGQTKSCEVGGGLVVKPSPICG